MSVYTFSVADDFKNASNINLTDLHESINNNLTITTDIEKTGRDGDIVVVTFASPLSGPEQTELNAIVDAYIFVEPLDDNAIINCYIYSTGVLNLYDDSSPFDIPLDQEDILDVGFQHTANSSEIIIQHSGIYKIDSKVTTQSINGQSLGKFWLEYKPPSGSYFKIPGSECFYTSTDPEQTTVNSNILHSFVSGTVIKMVAQGLGVDDDFILISNNSSILITRAASN